MEAQEWIDGAFEETDTDYTIAGMNILYKKETEYLKKGVKLLCDKLHHLQYFQVIVNIFIRSIHLTQSIGSKCCFKNIALLKVKPCSVLFHLRDFFEDFYMLGNLRQIPFKI